METRRQINMIRVAARTNPNALAEGLLRAVNETGRVRLRAVGAAAINQMVKAIAIGRAELLRIGADLNCAPMFSVVFIDGSVKSAISIDVELRCLSESRSEYRPAA